MPHLHKPEYTKPIPAGAVPATVKGKPGVRWKGRGGRWVSGVVCEGNPSRCRVEAGVWHMVYEDQAGATVDEPAYPDRAASEALLAERVKRAARIKAGLLSPEVLKPAASMAELIGEFHQYLVDEGHTANHCSQRKLHVTRVVAAAGATRPADLTPARVMSAVAEVGRGLAFSRSTAGKAVASVKQFTRWLAQTRKSEATDHLSGLRGKQDDTQPTFTRRSLSPDQYARLLRATERSRRVFAGLVGAERACLYLVASSTGMRAGELAALTPGQVTLTGGTPTVTCRAAFAKGRRHDELPLVPAVVEALRLLVRRRSPGEPLWPNREASKWAAWWLNAAEMVRQDLAEAGIPLADAAGAVFDFHSLRVQFATDLDRAGVGLPSAQRLMRHSCPNLTSKYYTKRSAGEMAAEVNKLDRPTRRRRKP